MIRALQIGLLVACVALVGALSGCTIGPFARKERTSIITPPMRVAAIREMGAKAHDADAAEQQKMCEQLAAQIRTEPDPIIRRAIQETIAEFKTPLADAVLVAGLSDDDRDVRIACCKLAAKRQDEAAIAKVSQLAAADGELDVRLAAVDALGKFKSPASMPGLAAALKDRDPAMQYAGVEAMKSSTGEKLGNDVAAWRQLAEARMGAGAAATAVATKPDAGALNR